MVAMSGTGRGERDVEPAMDTAEGLGAAAVATTALGSRQANSFSGYAGEADGSIGVTLPDKE